MPNVLVVEATSVAAYSKSADLFANEPGRVIERPSIVEFLIVTSATGMRQTIMVGSRMLVNDQPCNPSNRFPIDPDDVVVRTPAVRGEQVQVNLRNTTAGALTGNVVVKITPVR